MWQGHSPEPLSSSWQLLQSFEDLPLGSILQQIQEKHDLQKAKKVRVSSPEDISSPPGWEMLGSFSRVPGILF